MGNYYDVVREGAVTEELQLEVMGTVIEKKLNLISTSFTSQELLCLPFLEL